MPSYQGPYHPETLAKIKKCIAIYNAYPQVQYITGPIRRSINIPVDSLVFYSAADHSDSAPISMHPSFKAFITTFFPQISFDEVLKFADLLKFFVGDFGSGGRHWAILDFTSLVKFLEETNLLEQFITNCPLASPEVNPF